MARRAAALLYRLLRGHPHGTVILPANVCPAVPLAVRRAGHDIALVDIDEETLALDLDQAADLLRSRPGAYSGLVYVRPYGALFDVEPRLRDLRRGAEQLLLIDDRCLCLPELEPARSDTVDACLWSTGPRKSLDLGGGGMAAVRPNGPSSDGDGDFDPAASRRVEALCKARITAGLPFLGDGGDDWLDLRPSEIDWPTYRGRIAQRLSTVARRKASLNAIYAEIIPQEAQLLPAYQTWRFNVRVAEPDALCARLVSRGLFAGRHYTPLGGVFAGTHADHPRARQLHTEIVNLFNDDHFDPARAEVAASIVREHCRQNGLRA